MYANRGESGALSMQTFAYKSVYLVQSLLAIIIRFFVSFIKIPVLFKISVLKERYLAFGFEMLQFWAKFQTAMMLVLVTTGGYELWILCVRSSYLTHEAIRPNILVGMWSLKFVIQINLEHDTIAVWNVARSWSISTQISYSCREVANSGTPNPPNLLSPVMA